MIAAMKTMVSRLVSRENRVMKELSGSLEFHQPNRLAIPEKADSGNRNDVA